MNCIEAAELLGARADGELDPAQARAVDEHLADCARCRAAAQSLEALGRAVALACPAQPAPARLRASLRASLRALDGHRDARRVPAGWLAAAPGLAALLLVAWILVAQPWSGLEPAPAGTRVVYHIAGNEHVASSLRTLRNHLEAAPDAKIVVVAHNHGVEFLLQGARDDGGRPYAAQVRELRARGVEFRVCSNTLTRRQIDARSVIAEAQLVPSGIAEISRLQAREGYTYLRL